MMKAPIASPQGDEVPAKPRARWKWRTLRPALLPLLGISAGFCGIFTCISTWFERWFSWLEMGDPRFDFEHQLRCDAPLLFGAALVGAWSLFRLIVRARHL